MTVRKTLKRFIVGFAFIGVSSSAAAFSYGILAAGVLVAAVAVVAAPYVGVALTAAQITGVMGAATVHSALAAYVFGQPVKPAPTMAPAMVTLINKAPTESKPVKVNLAPMSAAAKSKYQAAKSAQASAATTVPAPATPASGQASAEASARSQIQAGFNYVRDYAGDMATVWVACTDNGVSFVSCNVQCTDKYPQSGSWCNPPWQYVTGVSVNYTPGKPAVNCPTGSSNVGGSCVLNNDPSQDTIVNDGSATPQWNPAGLPPDSRMSADGSTISRSQNNSDGTLTTSNVTLQPDGSLNIVDSTYDPAKGHTVHSGYAVDTNGVVQGGVAAVSPGNWAGMPGAGIFYPNGNSPNGAGNGTGTGSGGGGGCGSAEKPNCDINFGTPDAGPAVGDADASEFNAVMATTVFDSLYQFKLPEHTSKCPTMDVATDYFGKSGAVVSTKAACDFVDANRASLSAIFSLIWAVAALLLILSA